MENFRDEGRLELKNGFGTQGY